MWRSHLPRGECDIIDYRLLSMTHYAILARLSVSADVLLLCAFWFFRIPRMRARAVRNVWRSAGRALAHLRNNTSQHKKKHMAFSRSNNRSRSARLAVPLGGAVWSHADWHANANGEQRLRHFIGYPRPPCLIKCHTYVWRAWPARLDFRSLVTVRSAAVACVEPHAKYFLEIDEPFAGIV